VFNGKKIMLHPGQLITGRKAIAEILNCAESKVTRVLKSFEIEQQIEQQTCTKNRLITVLSWHKYQLSEQQNEQQLNNNRTTTEQQLNTNKNVKKEKKERKEEQVLKREYAPFIFLTEDEYAKLTELLGDVERDNYFLRFASWISGQTKRVQESRSAYLSILNWHREDQKKVVSMQRTNYSQPTSKYQRTKDRLQQLQEEAEAREREQYGNH
jgi:hypothetical protein